MLIRGIVTKEELQQIQTAAAYHERNDESQDLALTWNEGTFIWVEVEFDVNETVMGCLQNFGFFDGIE